MSSFSSKDYVYSGFYWALFVFLMLIGGSNFITNMFSESKFLINCGKFSFGIYLLHPMCLAIISENIKLKSTAEHIILCVLFAYVVGYLFFTFIEVNLMLIANKLCQRIESTRFFEKKKLPISGTISNS